MTNEEILHKLFLRFRKTDPGLIWVGDTCLLEFIEAGRQEGAAERDEACKAEVQRAVSEQRASIIRWIEDQPAVNALAFAEAIRAQSTEGTQAKPGEGE